MALRCSIPLLLAQLVAASSGFDKRGGFLVPSKFQKPDIEATLQVFLQGKTSSVSRRMSKIDAVMRSRFQAMPTNTEGRLSPQALRYLVHGYFAQEHGWLIRGLGSHDHQGQQGAPEMHDAEVLRRAPEILEALMDARHSSRGFTLQEAVAMAAALERLIVDDAVILLKLAYQLNSIMLFELIEEEELREVVMSFFLLFEVGVDANSTNIAAHIALKDDMEATAAVEDSYWSRLDEFQKDTLANFIFERRYEGNPFKKPRFSFDDALVLVETFFESYGRWQNLECHMMKEELMRLDTGGFGRVPLSIFFSQPDTQLYKFGESVDYLRQVGALEEVKGRQPNVLIANYLVGPSNCVAGSAFYSVCCLSECTELMGELEALTLAPTLAPDRLLHLVGNMSSSSVEAPRRLPKALVTRLHDIAKFHGGEVHLHGRLFAQWMHYAFPLECQYPQTLRSHDVLHPSSWAETGHSATESEKQYYIERAQASDSPYMAVDEETEMAMLHWKDEEVLPFQSPRWYISFATTMRRLVHIVMLFALLRAAYSACKASVRACSTGGIKEKSHCV